MSSFLQNTPQPCVTRAKFLFYRTMKLGSSAKKSNKDLLARWRLPDIDLFSKHCFRASPLRADTVSTKHGDLESPSTQPTPPTPPTTTLCPRWRMVWGITDYGYLKTYLEIWECGADEAEEALSVRHHIWVEREERLSITKMPGLF